MQRWAKRPQGQLKGCLVLLSLGPERVQRLKAYPAWAVGTSLEELEGVLKTVGEFFIICILQY